MSLADRIAVMHQGRIVQAASPVEVYRNPAARFVGSFIGNPPMNFLPAKKARRRQLVGRRSDACPARGRTAAVEFAIRPEDVDVAPGRHPGHGARGRAARRAHAGDGRRRRHLFRAVLDSNTDAKPGDQPEPEAARPTASAGSTRRRRPRSSSTHPGGARMAGLNKQDYVDRAVAVLKENDRGTYTVPTKGLYPFQWNWDSCLTALGQRHFDEDRAWTEIETLFAHQWPDGMVPHIVFHVDDDGYFPGPDVWRTGRPVTTSGITQPAVAGFAVRRLFDAAADRPRAAERARALLPKIDAWHRWFYENRDPQRRGPGRHHPPLGVRPRQLDRLGRGLRARADRRRRALRAPRHPARRSGAPADQGAVRPLPLAGAALPRPRLGQFASCTTPRRSRSSIPASTPS